MTHVLKRGMLLCLLLLASAGVVIGVAAAQSTEGPDDPAVITGSFSADCTDFDAQSSKQIDYVRIRYADGTEVKDESVDSTDYHLDGDKVIRYASVNVGDGSPSQRFYCDADGNPTPNCSDGADNDGDGLIDAADPGCHSDEDPSNAASYRPNTDNDERNSPEGTYGDPECGDNIDNDGDGAIDGADSGCTPKCSDGVDNDGDNVADTQDPGCHSDENPANPQSYNPNDDSEFNTPEGPPGDGEECTDGIDNDGDGLIDLADPGCQTPEDCDDGVDNDGDGKVDGDDPDCVEGPPGDPTCSDGIDNDGDGLIDGADPDCQTPPAQCADNEDNEDPEDTLADEDDPGCHTDGDPDNPASYDPDDNDETNGPEGPPGDPNCSDGIDNDGDNLIDLDDPDCQTPEDCDDGVDNDGDGLIDGDDPDCVEGPPGDPSCSDGIDNDGDGLIDLDDPDCQTAPEGRFTCRASALRIERNPVLGLLFPPDPFEPFLANAGGDPCLSEGGEEGTNALIDEILAGPPGSLTLRVLYSETESTPTAGTAEAGVAQVILADAAGVTILRADVLTTEAAASCVAGAPVLTSDSTVVGLVVAGEEIDVVGPDEIVIPLPIGTLTINYEDTVTTADGQQVTRRAIFLDVAEPLEAATGDVIIAESIADYHGDPCP